MSKKRDDFSAQTKRDMALRASYNCSLCKCSTVGPSEEGPSAITLIGVAAHISAAASGPGARRYDPTITAEQRSHIDNGIWLCASCATLIDRDQIRFTADDLRKTKRDHESSRRIGTPSATDEGDIIAIGPDIIVLGCVIRSSPEATRIRVSHFVNGSLRDLWSLTRIFETWPAERRYVLLNEMPSCQIILTRAPARPRNTKRSPPCGLRFRLCCTKSAKPCIPLRMSVCPIAIQTRAFAGIIARPLALPPPDQARPLQKCSRDLCRPIPPR